MFIENVDGNLWNVGKIRAFTKVERKRGDQTFFSIIAELDDSEWTSVELIHETTDEQVANFAMRKIQAALNGVGLFLKIT